MTNKIFALTAKNEENLQALVFEELVVFEEFDDSAASAVTGGGAASGNLNVASPNNPLFARIFGQGASLSFGVH
ncbi:hypothetical protein [Nostoc sp. UHCC 0251]|uniref:hypothetical protein n=1 Tax=Nostoc sp. UHCC 0251 TaxID=3110240 RepID=UPI002B1FA6A4|nr:hypothetical protein [Nostoc sp. UHCC 0251]MEA5627898.1 hypothetical protein [Nostoc sp. UHCC 0251]